MILGFVRFRGDGLVGSCQTRVVGDDVVCRDEWLLWVRWDSWSKC